MTQEALIPVAEFTHRLIYPDKSNSTKDDTQWRQKLLTGRQAQIIMEGINSKDPFLILGGEAFPKYGAYVKKLQPQELEQIQQHYQSKFLRERENRKREEEDADRAAKLETWKKENSKKWQGILLAGKKRAKKNFPAFSDRSADLIGKGYATHEAEKILWPEKEK